MRVLNLLEEWTRGTLRDPFQHFQPHTKRDCPCCCYSGRFVTSRWRGARDFRCPNCSSRPRDRQIALFLDRQGIDLAGCRFLHIAPEWPLFTKLRSNPNYVGGDIIKRRNKNAHVDITAIDFEDGRFDFVMANHVLEHVREDRKALSECFRVLKRGGQAIFTVPINGRIETWEPPAGMSAREIERICGWDHVRNYGTDLKDRITDAGFEAELVYSEKDDIERYSLFHGDVIFFARKP